MRLETERLLLRELSDDDWPAVFAYQRDPLYLRYYHWTERTPDDVKAFVAMLAGWQKEEPRTRFQLGIARKTTGELIGNCGVRVDPTNVHEANIGYEIAPPHWDLGYATEAASAIVQFGFSRLSVHRISAWCVADNVGSANVLRKVGMTLEGQLREVEYYKDRWWDHLVFATLVSDHERQPPLLVDVVN